MLPDDHDQVRLRNRNRSMHVRRHDGHAETDRLPGPMARMLTMARQAWGKGHRTWGGGTRARARLASYLPS
jgi:hypothetical protein